VLQVLLSKCRSCLALRKVLQVLLSKCRRCCRLLSSCCPGVECAAGAAVQVQELSGVEEGAAGAAVQVQKLFGVVEGAAV
jgi:hypothetical protein